MKYNTESDVHAKANKMHNTRTTNCKTCQKITYMQIKEKEICKK